MAWSPDFCLACDRQTTGGVYCSQACRLADLEHTSPPSEPASPVRLDLRPGSSPGAGAMTGFRLPPPVEFAAYRSPRPSTQSSSAAADGVASDAAHPHRPAATLTPSSSRSSLVSLQSAATSDDDRLSDQARSALRAYVGAFDRTREWKRRVALG